MTQNESEPAHTEATVTNENPKPVGVGRSEAKGMEEKVADRPPRITVTAPVVAVVVSSLALMVSAASCWEAREALRVNVVTSQAVVQVSNASIVGVQPHRRLGLILTNFGRAAALDLRVHYNEAALFAGESYRDVVQNPVYTYTFYLRPRVAPSASVPFEVGVAEPPPEGTPSLLLGPDRPKTAWSGALVLAGKTLYTDDLTSVHREESWCYIVSFTKPAGEPRLDACVTFEAVP